MKATVFNMIKYEADKGKVFDWATPRYVDEVDDEGNVIGKVQEHLYVKTLFIGGNDKIENYVEVDKP